MSEEGFDKGDLEYDLGEQPLHKLMEDYKMSNNDIVESCEEQLSHKAVGKARKGRRLSKKLQMKVLKAFNILGYDKHDNFTPVTREELFTY